MTNTINSPINGLDLNSIDQSLPFEGKEVWIWSVSKFFRSYGHWTLKVDIEVNGSKKTLTAITTDSLMIDNWDGLGGEDHAFLGKDYVGMQEAIVIVLKDNEERLIDMAEPETE